MQRTTSRQHGEREFSLGDAAERAQSAIAELGLTATLDCYGGDPTVWHCRLAEGRRELPSWRGHGKGRTEAARVGSMYEALEHYLTQRHSGQVVLLSCAEVAVSALAGEAYAGLLAQQCEESIACRVYTRMSGQGTLAVPLFLSYAFWAEEQAAALRTQLGDTTDYRSLARYASNSGSAIGGSPAEAAVHAINEAIERDAMSLFLIRFVLTATSRTPAFLDPATLPPELRTLFHQVQARIGREVWLIDMTTDLGVPSTLAYAPGPRGHFLRGYGTSLSRHYSIHRALTELVEVQLTDHTAANRRNSIGLLADSPGLQACAELDLRALAAAAPRVPYVDTTAPSSPSEHVSKLLARLAARGFTAYLNEMHRLSNGVTAVHVHIPGLERFHMIVDGPSAVVPGRRGIAAARPPADYRPTVPRR